MLGVARLLAIDTLYGTDRDTLLYNHVGHHSVGQAEGLYTGVVAAVEAVVNNNANAESCTECVANEVLVLLGRTELPEACVNFGQDTAQCLAVGVEVAVVVYEYGNAEFVLEERAQCHAVAERGEVGQVAADYAAGIVGWAGEGKAYCHGLLVELLYYLLKACYNCCKAFVEVVCVRGHRNGVDDEFTGFHCAEYEVCTSCIEGNYDAIVVAVHRLYLLKFFICLVSQCISL